MKKFFYKTFQKCSQNVMSRLNFELAAFCFDNYIMSLRRVSLKRKNVTPLFRSIWSNLTEWLPSGSPNWAGKELKHPTPK